MYALKNIAKAEQCRYRCGSLFLVGEAVGWKEALFEEKNMLKKLVYLVPQTVDDCAIYAVFWFEAYVVYEALFG